MQAQILWPWQNRVADSFRAGLPSNLSWIDDEVGGDVARMVLFDNPIRAQSTEFFNYDIKRTYLPAGQYFGRRVNGLQCPWAPNEAGVIDWGAACGPVPDAAAARQRLREVRLPRAEGARREARASGASSS